MKKKIVRNLKKSYVVNVKLDSLIFPVSDDIRERVLNNWGRGVMAEASFSKLSEIILPIRTVSEANVSEHWSKKSARHKLQKRIVKLQSHSIPKTLPIHIKFTRISPRKLDVHDNLRSSMKWILDEVCAQITGNSVAGRADDDDRITFEYDQITGSPGTVKIEFFSLNFST